MFKCYFFSYTLTLVFVSKLLNALAPLDLLPMKTPVLEKKGRKEQKWSCLYSWHTLMPAQQALSWGRRSSHVHAVSLNTNHSWSIQDIKCSSGAPSMNTSLHSEGQTSRWTIVLYLYPAFSWIYKFCILQYFQMTHSRGDRNHQTLTSDWAQCLFHLLSRTPKWVSTSLQLWPRHTQRMMPVTSCARCSVQL